MPTHLNRTTLRLSDGRVARLRGHDRATDIRVDALLSRVGIITPHSADMMEVARYRALLSIRAIDGRPLSWPAANRPALQAFAAGFADEDQFALARAYKALNPVATPVMFHARSR